MDTEYTSLGLTLLTQNQVCLFETLPQQLVGAALAFGNDTRERVFSLWLVVSLNVASTTIKHRDLVRARPYPE